MGAFQLGDIAIGLAVAVAYLAAWVAWLTLGVLPFVLAGLLFLAGRFGLPAVVRVSLRATRRGWGVLRQGVRQVVPQHAAAGASRF